MRLYVHRINAIESLDSKFEDALAATGALTDMLGGPTPESTLLG